jgi:CTP synthase (UTP-ammonia lyase)
MNLFEKVYKKSDSIVSRKIADEFLLVPIKQNVGDLESIYTLNEVATRVWELIDGKKKVKEIQDKIVEEFEVTPQEAEKDLANLVKQLLAVGAITKVQ